MATHETLSSLFTAIADAIRAKTGKTETIVADNFPAEIAAIEGGGGGKKLSELTEGSLISVLEDGKLVPFYVAKHNYEADLNGEGRTLLVRKDIHSNRVWDADGGKDYGASDISVWLNADYKDSLSATVKSQIGVTEFPCAVGNGNTTLTAFSRSVFLLSFAELNFTNSGGTTEGTALSIANVLKVAYLNGVASNYWLRSPHVNMGVFYMTADGSLGAQATTTSCGVRPCFTLPANMALRETPYEDGSYGLIDEWEPTDSIEITENGIHNVKEFSFANVNVQSPPVLLWTNASPANSFAAQTVNLPTGYDAHLVELRVSTGTGGTDTTLGISYVPFSNSSRILSSSLFEGDASKVSKRTITSSQDGSITFGEGASSAANVNTFGIPTRIWGIKFTL